MQFDISRLPDFIKIEVSKGDLEAFAKMLLAQSAQQPAPNIAAKEILTVDEAAAFTGLAKQSIYGMTSRREIPHFKRGKSLRFRRSELEAWLLENRRRTLAETILQTTLKPRKP